jgi:hypothetical protein
MSDPDGLRRLEAPHAPEYACRSCGSPRVELGEWTLPNLSWRVVHDLLAELDGNDAYCGACGDNGCVVWVPEWEDIITDEAQRDGFVCGVAEHGAEWDDLARRAEWGATYRA